MSTPAKQKIKAQALAVAIGIGLMGIKFAAFFITNSNAILTDALESIVNVSAGSFALYSVILASKPRDKDHPYGHGKVEFLSAGLEGGMIALAGVIIIGKSIYNFIYPQEIGHMDIGAWITGFAGAINAVVGWYLIKQGKAHRSLALQADGRHLMSDAYTSAGLLIGLVVIYITGIVWLDNVVAILFGLLLIYHGYKLLRESTSGIMDEADYKLLSEVIEVIRAERQENWIDIHNLRIIKYGSALHIDAHMTLPYYFDLKEAHAEISQVDHIVSDSFGDDTEFFIHADYCEPPIQCSICSKSDCKVRGAEYEGKVKWTLDNVMLNQRHQAQDLLDSPLK